ncbi:PREDICTED: serine/arginine repetitive matrix protein 1-like isoform X2 [Camelina sativa]|uniref:Serine/arginine repetitive matrix protein 1-like isoform X2 n=1 Tax=Camelina sativa TaxID=90675 RepID=A0ABM1Q8I1_CAMSA|nr:PREDICTED: serine/arginine repetitive matrix protein 1-like isoform X2 [Camelina sativa]
MSGGFFRGTSAEQDTRFSNKQAKLMKSQKFAPELENLVDVTKVKMDVMKPWIATRVTELLGFEDEVLINFIYGLLDGKVVNGKEIQISLTGFMEKNTGKFMKELWTLLLSAQNNSSGVPQQFLDAREADTKKKLEAAMQKANHEHDSLRKIDSSVDLKGKNGMEKKPSRDLPEDGRRADEKNGVKETRRDLISPRRREASRSPLRGSRSRSISKTNSGSRSYSGERKSRSLSRSSDASISPRKRRLSNSRHRSRSRSLRRSPSPRRRRIHSAYGSRSRSPIRRHRRSTPERRRQSPPLSRRRRSPSPFRRRRSPSPPARRRRSPAPPVRRRRSPSPPARSRRSPSPPARSRRSPARHRRSPLPIRRRRSPSPPARRHRSPSPLYRRNRSRSPLAKRGRSDSQGRSPSPVARRMTPTGARLPTPPAGQKLPSPPPRRAGLPSPMRFGGSHAANHLESPSPKSLSPPGEKKVVPSPPVRRRSSLTPAKERGSLSPAGRGEGESPSHVKHSGSMSPVKSRGRSSPSSHVKARSPVRRRSPTPVDRRRRRFRSADRRRRRSPSSSRSPSRSFSPPVRRRSPSPSRRRQQRDRRSPGHPSEEQDREDGIQSSKLLKRTAVQLPDIDKRKQLPEKVPEVRRAEHVKEQERKSDKIPERRSSRTHGSEMPPVSPKESLRVENSEGKSQPLSNKVKGSDQVEKEDNSDLDANLSSDSKENIRHHTTDRKRRKEKRSSREEVSSDDKGSSDSDLEDRKEAKRRRKEEKKTRKEEKKRKREERRRKREERRGGKLKHKNQEHSDTSEGDEAETYPKNKKGESDPKRLEIELRNKALESLKAKKGMSH